MPRRRWLIPIVVIALVVVFVAIVILVNQRVTRQADLDTLLAEYGFDRMWPPSRLHSLGSIVSIKPIKTAEGDEIRHFDPICSPGKAFGPGDLPRNESDTTSAVLGRRARGGVNLGAKVKASLAQVEEFSAVGDISIILSNAKIFVLSQDDIIPRARLRHQDCQESVTFSKNNNHQLAVIKSVLEADGEYKVTFQRKLTSEQRAQLLSDLALSLSAQFSDTDARIIAGKKLYWGIDPEPKWIDIPPRKDSRRPDRRFMAHILGEHFRTTFSWPVVGRIYAQGIAPSYREIPGVLTVWRGDGSGVDIVEQLPGRAVGGVSPAPDAGSFSSGRPQSAPALNFDGTTGSLEIRISTPPQGNHDRALTLWFRVNKFMDVEEAFFAGYGSFGTVGRTYHLGTSMGRVFFSNWGSALFGPVVREGEWHHLAVTNRTELVRLFLDGVEAQRGELLLNTDPESSFFLGMLPRPLGDIRRLNGTLADVRLYTRALNPDEIRKVYEEWKPSLP